MENQEQDPGASQISRRRFVKKCTAVGLVVSLGLPLDSAQAEVGMGVTGSGVPNPKWHIGDNVTIKMWDERAHGKCWVYVQITIPEAENEGSDRTMTAQVSKGTASAGAPHEFQIPQGTEPSETEPFTVGFWIEIPCELLDSDPNQNWSVVVTGGGFTMNASNFALDSGDPPAGSPPPPEVE